MKRTLYPLSLCLSLLLLAACQQTPLEGTGPASAPSLPHPPTQPLLQPSLQAPLPLAELTSFTQNGLVTENLGQLQMNIQWPALTEKTATTRGFGLQSIPQDTVRLRIRIHAPNQPTLEENLQRPLGSLTTQYRLVFLTLLSGSDRRIEVDAFNASDQRVASGQASGVTIQAQQFNHQRITLTPVSTAQPTPPPSSGGGGGGGGGGGSTPAPTPTPTPVPTPTPTATPINQVPTVTDIQFTNLQEISAGRHTATLTAVAQDPENDALSYQWSIDQGSLDSDTSNPTQWSSPTQNSVDATYVVTVTVSDGQNSTSFSKNMTVHNNQAPRVDGVQSNISETSFNQFNGQLTLNGTDPEANPLTYLWTDDPQTPVLQSLQGQSVQLKTNTPNGTYQLGVQVSDGQYTSTLTPYTLVLASGNLPPTIQTLGQNITYSNGSHQGALSASVQDPENRILGYQWQFIGDDHGAQLSNTTSLAPGFSGPQGNYTVRLTVTDNSVAPTQIVTRDLSFQLVNPNQVPVISSVTPNLSLNNGLYTGTLSVNASDGDNDPLSYSWSVISGVSNLQNTSGQNVNWSAGSGTHRIQVVANDGTSNSTPYIYETTLNTNQAPVITGIEVDNNQYILSGNLRQRNLTVQATDPENASLSYQWRVIEGSPAGQFYTAATPPNFPPDTLDSTHRTVGYRADANTPYVVEVQVSDGNQVSTYSRPVLLSNNPPYVVSTQYSVSCAGNGAYTLPITLSFLDPDNHPISNIQWSVSAGELSTGTDTQKTWSLPSAGSYTLNVGLSDPYSSSTATLNITVSGCP